jgi:hypothetical protein
MSEKTHNQPETQTARESSDINDPAPAKNVIEPNTESFENPAGEPENKGSEMKATPNHATDDPKTTPPPEKTREDTGLESEEPDTEGENKTSQFGSCESDDAEHLEIEEQSGTKDADHDRGGVDTDEVEEIQGSSEEKNAIEEIDVKKVDKGDVGNDDPSAQAQLELEATGAEEETDDIAEGKTSDTTAGKTSALKVAVSAILIAAAFSGFFLFDNKSKVKATTQKTLKASERRMISAGRQKKTMRSKPVESKISSMVNAKIEEITALRDSLLLKQEEVRRLKKHYQDGIEELEKEILDELQKGESHTFLQAMEDNAIAFTLRTIQRRQAYIQQLERPSRWIHQACEELLYLKRRTMMDIQVAEIAGGIDLDNQVRLINAAIRKYQPTADKLAPEMRNAQLEPLETIWERIQGKTQQYASARTHSKNQIISEQICAGNFSRLSELSEISAQTASCITEMRGMDLFLNGLTEISPAAARQLFHWKGSWVCLNGVRALSPRTAHYLFQWDGNWISLNGLTEFPAEIGEALLQWDGRQLELMGLQYAEDFPTRIALEYLARWERAGGKLFVPQDIRKKIDGLHGEST